MAATDPLSDAVTQRLPERLDTLGALALAQNLSGALAFGRAVRLDAAGVAEIGLVALQLLTAARAEAERRRQALAIVDLAADVTALIRRSGFGPVLLGDADEPLAGRYLTIRFTEAALRFGGEPIERLEALAGMGASLHALFAPEDAALALAEPDRLRIAFAATFAAPVDEGEVAEVLGVEEGACLIEWRGAGDVAPVPPAEPSPPLPPPPPAPPDISAPQERLDALVSLVGDLIASQAGLMEAIGTQRAALALPLADLDRTVGALQDGVLAMTTARLDRLAATLPAADRLAVSGGEIEIDRALFARLAPVLNDLLTSTTGGIGLRAAEESGMLLLRLSLPDAAGGIAALGSFVRSAGGRAAAVDDGVELRLPRSRSLIEAIILDVGNATYALPVSAMIEVLRPMAAMLHQLDPERTMLRFRERYVPLVAIGRHFGLEGWEADPQQAVLVVVHAGREMVAIQADAISDQRQVALKPLGGGLTPPPGIAGAAIIGAHRIALVLDLAAFEPAA